MSHRTLSSETSLAVSQFKGPMSEIQPSEPELDNPLLSDLQATQLKAQIASFRFITRNHPIPPILQLATEGVTSEPFDFTLDAIGNVTIVEDGGSPLFPCHPPLPCQPFFYFLFSLASE